MEIKSAFATNYIFNYDFRNFLLSAAYSSIFAAPSLSVFKFMKLCDVIIYCLYILFLCHLFNLVILLALSVLVWKFDHIYAKTSKLQSTCLKQSYKTLCHSVTILKLDIKGQKSNSATD